MVLSEITIHLLQLELFPKITDYLQYLIKNDLDHDKSYYKKITKELTEQTDFMRSGTLKTKMRESIKSYVAYSSQSRRSVSINADPLGDTGRPSNFRKASERQNSNRSGMSRSNLSVVDELNENFMSSNIMQRSNLLSSAEPRVTLDNVSKKQVNLQESNEQDIMIKNHSSYLEKSLNQIEAPRQYVDTKVIQYQEDEIKNIAYNNPNPGFRILPAPIPPINLNDSEYEIDDNMSE